MIIQDPNPQPAPAPAPSPAPAPAPSDTPPAPGDEAPPPSKAERPAGFGDAFNSYWNDETGADYAKLGEDLTALQALKAEHDERMAGVPENLEEYEIAVPENFKLPDGARFELDPASPVTPLAREWAKQNGITKEKFKEMVSFLVMHDLHQDQQAAEASAKEVLKLGSKGPERRNAIAPRATALLVEKGVEPNRANELGNSVWPMVLTARQVEFFEAILGPTGTPIGGGRDPDVPDGISDEEYDSMSLTQRLVRNSALAEKNRKAS